MGKNANGYPSDAYSYTKALQYQHPASRYVVGKNNGPLANIAGVLPSTKLHLPLANSSGKLAVGNLLFGGS